MFIRIITYQSDVNGMYILVQLYYSLVAFYKTTSRSLLLITEGTDDRISAIDNSASQELQLSIINSKLPNKNLFHRKCVYLLHDQFDGRKKQKCVCYFYVFLFFFFSFIL